MMWSEIEFDPSERKLRAFAVLFFVAATTLAVWQSWANERWMVAGIIFALGAFVALLGLLVPSAVRPLYIGMMVASFPMGWVMSHLLLAIVYFGLFTPLAVIFRLTGRDVLRLRPNPESASYLKIKAAPPNSQSYFRPF